MVAGGKLAVERLEQRLVLSASLQGLGPEWAFVNDVSDDGTVVVGRAFTTSGAVRWTSSTGIVGLGGSSSSSAEAVSADGSVIVGSDPSLTPDAFRWTADTGMSSVLLVGSTAVTATGVSADGTIVVGLASVGRGQEAYRAPFLLGNLPGGGRSGALGVSADGAVVVGVGFNSGSNQEAFRWTATTGMVGLGDLAGGTFHSQAEAASADGSVVIGYGSSSSGLEAFYWTEDVGMVGLGFLPGGITSRANDVSGDGSIVVGTSDFEAFVWDSVNGMHNIETILADAGVDLTGWTLNEARAISADGRFVVGRGTHLDSAGVVTDQAWLAMLPGPPDPEPPMAMDDVVETDEETLLDVSAEVGLLSNDTGEGAPLTVTEVNGHAANIGTQITLPSGALLTVNADGSFTFDPNGQFESVRVGASETDSFTYTMTDSNGVSDSATVLVVIDGLNDPPTAIDDENTTDEDTTLIAFPAFNGVLANDTDIDDGDSNAVSAVNGVTADVGAEVTLPSGALLTLNSSGIYTYDPNGQFEHLQVGTSATDSFEYTMTDGGGATDSATVTITIEGVNDAPVAVDDAAETNADAAVTVPAAGVLANDTDVDDGDTKAVSAVNGVAADVGSQVTLASGALVTLNADGSFTYDPNGAFDSVPLGDTALDSFAYTMVDSQGATASAMVNVTVHGVEVAPIAVVIDVKPGSDANSINLNEGNGMIAVAVFTTDEFDAAQVDASTVQFAGASAAQSALEDVDGDGDLDMILHFREEETNLRAIYEQFLADDMDGDGVLDSTHQTYTASLTGETINDELFEGFDDLNLFLSGRHLREVLDELFA